MGNAVATEMVEVIVAVCVGSSSQFYGWRWYSGEGRLQAIQCITEDSLDYWTTRLDFRASITTPERWWSDVAYYAPNDSFFPGIGTIGWRTDQKVKTSFNTKDWQGSLDLGLDHATDSPHQICSDVSTIVEAWRFAR